MVERQRQRYIRSEKASAEPTGKRRPGISFKFLLVLCVVAALIFAYTSGRLTIPSFGAQASPTSTLTEAYLEGSFDAQFLKFTHSKHNFTVSYPVGYVVQSSNADPFAARFYAEGNNLNVPVSVYFFVTNESFSSKDYSAFVNDLASDPSFSGSIGYNGSMTFGRNSFYYINASVNSEDAGEQVFVSFAFLNCPNYSVLVNGIVPDSSKGERFVVRSALESFECG